MGAADVAGAVGAWGSAGAVGVAWVAGAAALLAAVATALEAASPAGLDNLSVPLGVSALYAVLFLPASWYTPALVGLLLSGAVVLASFRLRLLTVPGGLGAVVVGTLAFAFGGWPLWLLLMWFFGSANIAARFMARRAARRGERGGRGRTAPQAPRASQALKPKREEGEPRKLRQVLANSLPFLACAAASAATGDPWLLVVSAGALAACTADTWASEVGVYSKDDPVNILTRQPMQRGLSGGVSPLGLLATVVGSAATAALALLLFRAFASPAPTEPTAFFLIMACGVVGSLVDSVLGARLQAKYRCPGIPLLVEAVPAGEAAVAGPGAFPPPVGVVSEVAAAGEAAPAGEGRPAQGVQGDEDCAETGLRLRAGFRVCVGLQRRREPHERPGRGRPGAAARTLTLREAVLVAVRVQRARSRQREPCFGLLFGVELAQPHRVGGDERDEAHVMLFGHGMVRQPHVPVVVDLLDRHEVHLVRLVGVFGLLDRQRDPAAGKRAFAGGVDDVAADGAHVERRFEHVGRTVAVDGAGSLRAARPPRRRGPSPAARSRRCRAAPCPFPISRRPCR